MYEKKISKTLLVIISILVVVIIAGIIIVFNTPIFHSLENIDEPVQTSCSYELFSTSVDRQVTKITKVANYKIKGIVLAVNPYFPVNTIDKLSIIDVVIGWGNLTVNDNYKKFSALNIINRELIWKMDSNSMSELGGLNDVISNFSMNHLIYKDQSIRDDFGFINKGDYIELEGYLVNVDFEEDGEWNTSLSRTDTGSKASEIIYVEHIKWLKKNIEK